MSYRKRSSLHLETLESRNLLSGVVFHNSESPFDVNGDELVTAMDALIVIQRLNAPQPNETDVPPVHFADVNDDGIVSAFDALSVIRRLNSQEPTADTPEDSTAGLRLASQLSSSSGSAAGTVDYERDLEEGVIRQSLQVQIEKALPETTLQVSIDGHNVGSIKTDQDGSAELRLSSDPGEGEQPLPEDFPEMEALMTVNVGAELNGILDEINGVTSVDVVGGDLVIHGDDDNNFVLVTQLDDQEYLVVGVNTALENRDGGEVFEDELDGVDLYFTIATGVRDDFRVHMRDGDDIFVMGGYIGLLGLGAESDDNGGSPQLQVPGRLDILAQGGDDLVYVGGTNVGAGARISAGQGEQNVVAVGGGGAFVGAMDLDLIGELFDILDFLLIGGEGGGFELELLEIARSVFGETSVHHDLIIDTYTGDDAVYVGDAYLGDELIINTRQGHDAAFVGTGGVLDLDTFGLGDDFADLIEALDVEAHVYIDGYLHIHTHGGDDLVRLGGAIELQVIDNGSEPGRPLSIPGGLEVDKSAHVHTLGGYDGVLIGVKTFEFDVIEPLDAEGENGIYELGYDVRIGQSLHVHSGSDGDLVQIGGTLADSGTPDASLLPDDGRKVLDVGHSLFIITGSGADEVLLLSPQRHNGMSQFSAENGPSSPNGYDINVGHRAHIDTGSGDDDVRISGSELRESNGLNPGVLRTGRDLFIATGSGRDEVWLNGETNFVGANDNGNGYGGIAVGDDLFIITGSGEDDIFIRSVDVDDYAHLNSGSHHDLVLVDHLYANALDAFLGGHDDCFTIADSHAERWSRAVGGWGFDRYFAYDTDIDFFGFEAEVDCFD